jgi:F-type H+-transporting ATPase subunit b
LKRFSFSFAYLGVLLAGLLVFGAASLSHASAASLLSSSALAATAPATVALPVEQPQNQEGSGGELDTSIYRHSASVRAIGRLLHLDQENAAELFEYLNFAILVVAVLYLFLKYLPKIFRERRERLQQQLIEARNATEQAKERLRAVEAQFARLDQEIAKIRAQAEQDGSAEEARIKALIETERERIIASAEQEISAAAAAARRDLKRFAADLAVDRAERMISLSEEGDQALLRQFAGNLSEESRNGRNHE